MRGFKYVVIFVDDYFRYTWLYLMKNRPELTQLYRSFVTIVKTQFSCHIETFCVDNAIEYNDSKFLELLQYNGTMCHRSCLGTIQ